MLSTIYQLIRISVFIVSVAVFSLQSANAQSFGSLIKDVKKLEKELSKKETPKEETQAEQKQQPKVRRSQMSPQELADNPTLHTYNRDKNSALCFQSGSMGFEAYEVCIPETELRSGRDYSVKNMFSPSFEQIKASQCEITSPPNSIEKFSYLFELSCLSADDQEYSLSLRSTPEFYEVSDFNMTICGPAFAANGEDFKTRLQERYGMLDMNPTSTSQRFEWDDKDHESLTVMKLYKDQVRGSASKCFSDTGAAWLFNVAVKKSDYKKALQEYQLSKQAVAEDF